jgi:hypothetical protein
MEVTSLRRWGPVGTALDPLLGEAGGGIVGPGRAELAAAMGPSSVVMGLVFGQDCSQVPFAADQHPVGDLGPGGEHEPLRVGVRPWARGGIFTASMPALARTASKKPVNCPALSRTRNRKSATRSPGVHQEIADLLGGPRPVRVRGDPEDVYVTGADPAAGPLHPVGQSPLAGWPSSDGSFAVGCPDGWFSRVGKAGS